MRVAQDAFNIWKQAGTFFRGIPPDVTSEWLYKNIEMFYELRSTAQLNHIWPPLAEIYEIDNDTQIGLRRHLERISNVTLLESQNGYQFAVRFTAIDKSRLEMGEQHTPTAMITVTEHPLKKAVWRAVVFTNEYWRRFIDPAERYATCWDLVPERYKELERFFITDEEGRQQVRYGVYIGAESALQPLKQKHISILGQLFRNMHLYDRRKDGSHPTGYAFSNMFWGNTIRGFTVYPAWIMTGNRSVTVRGQREMRSSVDFHAPEDYYKARILRTPFDGTLSIPLDWDMGSAVMAGVSSEPGVSVTLSPLEASISAGSRTYTMPMSTKALLLSVGFLLTSVAYAAAVKLYERLKG